MPFQPYEPSRQRPSRVGATALKTGVIQLSTGAYRALGEPSYVAIDHDPTTFRFRVRLAPPEDPRAVAVMQQRRVAATRLLRAAGIDYATRSAPLIGRMEGRTTLILHYGHVQSKAVAA